MNLDNSKSSAAEDVLSTKERNVRIFAKEMLQGRIFLGHFQESRFVESLQAYRDVIAVNKSEIGLTSGIEIVRERLKKFYKSDYWIGITDPAFIGASNEYCLWVEPSNSALGFYCYKIRSVRFRKNEIIVKVKIIRPMTQIDTQIFTQDVTDRETDISFDAVVKTLISSVREDVKWFFKTASTAENIKQAFTFVCILLAMVITSTVYGIRYFMDFVLKLIHVISVLVQSSTPVMIAVIRLLEKVIGGFYLLIARLFTEVCNAVKSSQHYAPPPERLADHRNRIRPIEMPRYRNSDPLNIDIRRRRDRDSSIRRSIEMPRYRDNDPLTIRTIEIRRCTDCDLSIRRTTEISGFDFNSSLQRAIRTRTCGDPFELCRRAIEIHRDRNSNPLIRREIK